MRSETRVTIEAPAEAVWAVVVDVERWAEWTPSIQSIKLLDGSVLTLGSKARVKQPGVPAVVWQVTSLEPGRSFTWEARNIGSRSVGHHTVEAVSEGRCVVTLAVEQSGVFMWLARPLIGPMTRRYINMEAAGLKKRCEGA